MRWKSFLLGFPVERKESPFSKVVVLMLQITTTVSGGWESEAKFVVRIKDAANELVGQYNITEHNTY
jgi:hypothetical protein